MPITPDICLTIFLFLNLLDLNNISYVCKKKNFLVFSITRYKKHFKLSNSFISEKKMDFIL